MSYCPVDEISQHNIVAPTYPSGESCVVDDDDGKRIYSENANTTELQNAILNQYESQFNGIMNSPSNPSEKHSKINCLLGMMLGNIENNYKNYNMDLDELEDQLKNEKTHIEEQEKVLRSNENSELVTKYRN